MLKARAHRLQRSFQIFKGLHRLYTKIARYQLAVAAHADLAGDENHTPGVATSTTWE